MQMQDDKLRADFLESVQRLSPANRVILAIYMKIILMSKWMKFTMIATVVLYAIAIIFLYVTSC